MSFLSVVSICTLLNSQAYNVLGQNEYLDDVFYIVFVCEILYVNLTKGILNQSEGSKPERANYIEEDRSRFTMIIQ